jgi:competence protein ComEA
MSITLPQVISQISSYLPKKKITQGFLGLGVLGVLLLLFVLGVYIFQLRQSENDLKIVDVLEENSGPIGTAGAQPTCCTVEVSGAVAKPGSYQVEKGSRIQQVLLLAGGFDPQADAKYVNEKIHLLDEVKEGEKIFIPFASEVPQEIPEEISEDGNVSVNTATRQELIALPVIGEKTADQIISLRPYQSLEEFFEKNSFSQKEEDTLKKLINAR